MTFLQEYPIITRYVIGKKTIWLGLLTLHMNFYPVRPKLKSNSNVSREWFILSVNGPKMTSLYISVIARMNHLVSDLVEICASKRLWIILSKH